MDKPENIYNIDEVNWARIMKAHEETGRAVLYLSPDEKEYYDEVGNPFTQDFIVVTIDAG